MSRALRSGFSLMEVLLATSILLASLIVLGQLATVGRMHARDAERLTTAQLLCQSKLNEILAGVERVRPVEEESLEEGWIYSVEVRSVDKLHLASLRVTVSEAPDPDEEIEGPPAKQFTLTRWIRDPNYQDSASPGLESPLTAPIGPELEGGELP